MIGTLLIAIGAVLVLAAVVQRARQADVAMHAALLADIGRRLEAAGWQPAEVYVCGCSPAGLCGAHATIRANVAQRRPGPLS